MLNVNDLRIELVAIANVVKEHAEVADKVSISVAYLMQIRNGKNAKLNTKENRRLLTKIISTYRSIGRKKEKDLQKVLS